MGCQAATIGVPAKFNCSGEMNYLIGQTVLAFQRSALEKAKVDYPDSPELQAIFGEVQKDETPSPLKAPTWMISKEHIESFEEIII